MKNRLIWVDQAKGIGIFLVIYAHNNPWLESYFYSFHMPLFFFISGMFHPDITTGKSILKRAKSILIPYFVWSLLLCIFWFFLGRHYGDSLNYNLDPLNGFLGVFYAQGDKAFMDWGIPMWFLPCLFLSFLILALVKKIKIKTIQYILIIVLITLGFIYPYYFNFKLPWSIDVACASLIFYATGHFFKIKLIKLNSKHTLTALICILFLSTFLTLLNSKVDMYRSTYGSIPLFIINGFSGSLFVLLLCKKIKFSRVLTFLGQNTIPLLALQFRAITVVKVILIGIGITTFNFNEPSKLLLSFIQVLLIWPIIFLVNKYTPILNGKIKR